MGALFARDATRKQSVENIELVESSRSKTGRGVKEPLVFVCMRISLYLSLWLGHKPREGSQLRGAFVPPPPFFIPGFVHLLM